MIASSASRSISETKSFAAFSFTATMSRLRVARLMMPPARRAALTAMVSIGCIVMGETSRARGHGDPIAATLCALRLLKGPYCSKHGRSAQKHTHRDVRDGPPGEHRG